MYIFLTSIIYLSTIDRYLCTDTQRLYFQTEIGLCVKGFIDLVSTPPTKVLLLGPTYSSQAEVVADVAGHYNLLQVGAEIKGWVAGHYNLLQ